jgi:cytoskeletal protein RodZ
MKQISNLSLIGVIWLAMILGCTLPKDNSNGPSSPTQNSNSSSTQNASTTSSPTPQRSQSNTASTPSTSSSAPGVTMANYTRLKTGMTYAQVVEILGKEGTELSSNEISGIKTVMYQWEGEGFGANMNAMFQNGKMIQKAQFGLK